VLIKTDQLTAIKVNSTLS